MARIYLALFALAVIAVNPFGLSEIEIWVIPKVVCLLAICGLNMMILITSPTIKTDRSWIYWSLWLATGLISTLQSVLPLTSITGSGICSDGLFYWSVVAVFCITNGVVVRQTNVFRWQLTGFLIGAAISSAVMLAQVAYPSFDYTVYKFIYAGYQPVGLYSHRGYAAFTVALSTVALHRTWKAQWLSNQILIVGLLLFSSALLLSNVRGAILAAGIAWGWIGFSEIKSKWARQAIIATVLAGLLAIGYASASRKLEVGRYGLSSRQIFVENITSGRAHLWREAYKRFREKPIFGHGFGGMAIVDGVKLCYPESVVGIQNHQAFCSSGKVEDLFASRAHNGFLDDLVSLGITGTSMRVILFIFCAKEKTSSITYLAYLLTWFDCSQISHLAWWFMTADTSEGGSVRKSY